jgi:antibiotic biosynthesis monooxygenase (ABM) superfamily enzyme
VEAGGDDLAGLLPAQPAGHRDPGALLADVPVVLRVVALTLTLTPLMTYVLLPWVTRRLGWWPAGRRWRDQ